MKKFEKELLDISATLGGANDFQEQINVMNDKELKRLCQIEHDKTLEELETRVTKLFKEVKEMPKWKKILLVW